MASVLVDTNVLMALRSNKGGNDVVIIQPSISIL